MKIPSQKNIVQFLKAQASSLIASAIDFTVFVICGRVLGLYVVVANMLGNVSGGVINFLINRNYVFSGADKETASKQGMKYAFVWIGSLLLNAGGIYLLVEVLRWEKILGKVTVSLLVGFFYNYLLQKNVVFKTERQEKSV
ncbi:MAG: GtrA family protein [Chitinophagaceae bacterium]